jgi:N-acetylglucosaminyl-diphospho-decaprenol L-rhamnosyltransferase
MHKESYAITFACYGQLEYTKLCIESMVRHGTPLDRLVIVDNGSKDDTRAFLETLPLGGRIYNRENLGCGAAWNQGALALQADWTIVMNNDVVVSDGWIDKLIEAGEHHGLKVISPSLVEGKLDYDLDVLARDGGTKMRDAVRVGWAHAVCMAIHRSVWQDVGFFQPIPKLLGYEDTLFFNELKAAGVRMGTTGASWLHHFGSITQSAMKVERGIDEGEGLGDRYNYKLLRKNWLRRKVDKLLRNRRLHQWASAERAAYGMTMIGYCDGGPIQWT